MPPSTIDCNYAENIHRAQNAWWRRFLNVQLPYAWNLRRLRLGFCLDIGCGVGRNLKHLQGNGVGIDHNLVAVQYARREGLSAFTPEEFQKSAFNVPDRFDSLLFSHVAEHMSLKEACELLRRYVGLIKPRGQLVVIAPQEAGFKKDPTHIEPMDFEKMRGIAQTLGFEVFKEFSFPLPRFFGKCFYFNEFVSIARRPLKD